MCVCFIPEMYYHLSPEELREKIGELQEELQAEKDKSIMMADAIRASLSFIDDLPWHQQISSLISQLKKALKVAEGD